MDRVRKQKWRMTMRQLKEMETEDEEEREERH